MKRKPTHYQKTFLVFSGLLLSFVLLEAGLRLAGLTLTVLQENRNRIALKKGSDYRILCLGESTTQGQYPPFLEARLNQNKKGVKFIVLDKGRSSTNTAAILSQAEAFLDQYHPDMVVAMMGINDGAAPHMPHENPSVSTAALFLKSFKTYKLARLLWLHIVTKTKPDPKNVRAYVESANADQQQGRFVQAEVSLKKALELNPRDPRIYVELGNVYRQQGLADARPKAKGQPAWTRDPGATSGKDQESSGTSTNYGRLAQAETSFKKALELDPGDEKKYVELGAFYQQQGQSAQAEASFKKAQELDPRDGRVYFFLGCEYEGHRQFARAEANFKKALELDPKDERIYIELGNVYRQQGQFKRAERCLRKGLELLGPHTSLGLYGELAAVSERTGQITRAREYDEQANQLAADRSANINPSTVRNYRALKALLDKRRIRLVCVQYPMRPVMPLRKIFIGEGGGITFVDNENIFRDAIRQNGINAYFRDMFGGNFGHCTDSGNRLLGENIAKIILRGLFGE